MQDAYTDFTVDSNNENTIFPSFLTYSKKSTIICYGELVDLG